MVTRDPGPGAPYQADGFSLVDGEIIDARHFAALVPGATDLPADGIFTTVKVRKGHPVFLRDHLARLNGSIEVLGLGETLRFNWVADGCGQVLHANEVSDGALRILVYLDPETQAPRRVIQIRDGGMKAGLKGGGIRLTTIQRDPDGTGPHKRLDFRANLKAVEEAQRRNCDEALFVSAGGEAWECARSNIFAVREGIVHTPSVTSGALPGVIRARLLSGATGVKVIESPLPLEFLLQADEVFVSNSLLGVHAVTTVDDHRFPLQKTAVARKLAAWLEIEERNDRSNDSVFLKA